MRYIFLSERLPRLQDPVDVDVEFLVVEGDEAPDLDAFRERRAVPPNAVF